MPRNIGLDLSRLSDQEKALLEKEKDFYVLVFSEKPRVVDKDNYLIVYGIRSETCKTIIKELENALPYARSDTQRNMIELYIKHFRHGNLDDHIDSQRQWIKDISPPVETNLGFIETYRDPAGTRAEYEGFVSVVNKEVSKKYKLLVDTAEEILPDLPWPKEYEKAVFQKPDFTSLDVIVFVGSGIPAGINIPNYDIVRQHDGFKNVSLGNVIASGYAPNDDKPIKLIHPDDYPIFRKYAMKAFNMDVAGHELLGHGSGKLLTEKDKNLINPLTNKPVTYYKEGETYDSVFGDLGSTFEECRAELAGLYLMYNPKMLEIFDVPTQDQMNVIYTGWLVMMKGAIKGLVMHDGKWRQAHCQARYAIFRQAQKVKDFIRIERDPEVRIVINKDPNTLKKARFALAALLNKINIYKATADVTSARKMYDELTTLSPEEIELRDQVKKEAESRTVFVQACLQNNNNKVSYKRYEPTLESLIESSRDWLNELNK